MRVWRIARAAYGKLDGAGAERAGGRWNSPGRSVVYTATHPALAALELLAHLDPSDVPNDLQLFTIDIPDGLATTRLAAPALPPDWRAIPNHPACRAAGDAWLEAAETPLLLVPSAILPDSGNVLINPRHPATAMIITEAHPFAFDPRLL